MTATKETTTPWDSVRCNTACIMAKGSWGKVMNGVVFLRDTNRDFYENRLCTLKGHDYASRFEYGLPLNPKQWEQSIMARLSNGVQTHQEVRVFSVANARDHYLGQFFVAKYEARTSCGKMARVTLARAEVQDESVMKNYANTFRKRTRSQSELDHLTVLEDICPLPWVIKHEPECAINFDVPLVQSGQRNKWASGEYTIDYVAARGCKRVCFESKPSWENAMDADAIEKCRCHRDRSMCRVFIGRWLLAVSSWFKNSQTPTHLISASHI